jgi:hypothetical protein
MSARDNTTCEPTGQRGVTRPQGPACDIGAYERIPAPTARGPRLDPAAEGAVRKMHATPGLCCHSAVSFFASWVPVPAASRAALPIR